MKSPALGSKHLKQHLSVNLVETTLRSRVCVCEKERETKNRVVRPRMSLVYQDGGKKGTKHYSGLAFIPRGVLSATAWAVLAPNSSDEWIRAELVFYSMEDKCLSCRRVSFR